LTEPTETGKSGSPEPRFIADAHLGRLARYLRLCGFDTLFADSLSDRDINEVSLKEQRIVLSRDKELLSNSKNKEVCRILSERPVTQLSEVIKKFRLREFFKPFSRCIECNGSIEPVSGDEIRDLLLPRTREFYSHFRRCRSCGKIYWEGSHYEKMKKFVDSL
jgi:uncharacterized protein with PIN domain